MSSKKKLHQNIIYNSIYQVFTLLLPVITIPYITRIFTATDLGINSYTLSIVQIFVILSFFGINQYGSREIAYTNNAVERNKIFWNMWLAQVAMTILSYILFMLMIPMFSQVYNKFLVLQGTLILLNMFEVSWFFIGIEDFKNVVFRNTAVKIIMTILVFFFVKTEEQLVLYMSINIFSVLFGNIILITSLRKKVGKIEVDIKEIKIHLKKSSVFLLPQLSILVYNTLDKTILGNLSNMDSVAFYDQSKKIVAIIASLIASISTVLLPRMSTLNSQGNYEEFKKLFSNTMNYVILLSFYLTACVIAVAPAFVSWFYGSNFQSVGQLMRVVSLIGIFSPISMIIGNALLVPIGREKIVVKAAIYAAIISFGFNLLLDGFIGAWGAVVALCIAECGSMLYRFFHARTHFEFGVFKVHIFQIILAFSISVTMTLFTNNWIPLGFIGTIISGLLVSIIFFVILVIMRNKVLLGLIWGLLKKSR